MTLLAKSVDGKSVDSLFGLFKHMIQTHYADPGVWEQHGRLHCNGRGACLSGLKWREREARRPAACSQLRV